MARQLKQLSDYEKRLDFLPELIEDANIAGDDTAADAYNNEVIDLKRRAAALRWEVKQVC